MAICRVCKSRQRDYIDAQIIAGVSPHKVFASLPEGHGLSVSSVYRHARSSHPVGGSRLIETVPTGERPGDHVTRILRRIDSLEAIADSAGARGNATLAIRAGTEAAKLSMTLAGNGIDEDAAARLSAYDFIIESLKLTMVHGGDAPFIAIADTLRPHDRKKAQEWDGLSETARRVRAAWLARQAETNQVDDSNH